MERLALAIVTLVIGIVSLAAVAAPEVSGTWVATPEAGDGSASDVVTQTEITKLIKQARGATRSVDDRYIADALYRLADAVVILAKDLEQGQFVDARSGR